MIADSRIFADVLQEIVESIQVGGGPYFLYGHYQSIADELIAKTQSTTERSKKYPLVILGIDSEYIEREISGMQYSVTANIWIVDETKREWFTSERFQEVFKTVLYPTYKKLLEAIFNSPYVSSLITEIAPETEPIPYWGTQTFQGSATKIVNDPLDAIRFKVQDLVINKNC